VSSWGVGKPGNNGAEGGACQFEDRPKSVAEGQEPGGWGGHKAAHRQIKGELQKGGEG